MKRACFALDIGGTKIAAALIDEAGTVLASTRHPTPAAEGGAAVLAQMAACLDELAVPASKHELVGIGISAAGVIDPARAIVVDATDAIRDWKGQDFRAYFGALHALPVWAGNDVTCALLGELWRNPALADATGTVAMLTLGTGLGGAIAHKGELLQGRHHLAGHFGRTIVWTPEAGLVPVETMVSGSGLLYLYRRRHGEDAYDGATVMALAHKGDAIAMGALEAWIGHLAVQLHNLHWSLDPDVVLLGGGVVDSRALWWDALERRIAAMNVPVTIAPATLGNRAGLVGAAKLVWNGSAA
ncbi:MAG: ROK family protein [Pseudomonadota bacterium]